MIAAEVAVKWMGLELQWVCQKAYSAHRLCIKNWTNHPTLTSPKGLLKGLFEATLNWVTLI